VAKKERQEDISFNHYTVNSRQEILCEPRATYVLWQGLLYTYISWKKSSHGAIIFQSHKNTRWRCIYTAQFRKYKARVSFHVSISYPLSGISYPRL